MGQRKENSLMEMIKVNRDILQFQIVKLIVEERERCAKIVEAMRPTGGRMWTDEQHATFEVLTMAAENIRNDNNIVIDSEGNLKIL